MANANLNPQGANTPVAGGYIQPSPGVTAAAVTQTDASGNLVKTVGAASGLAYFGTAGYRDSTVTVQQAATASAPTAGTAVATITPGTAGKWEVYGTVAISGTTVVAADSHNFELLQNAATVFGHIPYPLTGTTGSTTVASYGPVILNLGASDTVSVNAVGNATASSVYAASVVARLVG